MNKIDVENIKKEIAKRKAANYKWKSGGELSRNEITSKTDSELNALLEKFKNKGKAAAIAEIKKLVDEAFAKYSTDPEDNMIVLGACFYSDDSRDVYEVDSPLDDINFDGFNHDYNKLAYPIGRDYDLSYWEYKAGKQHQGKDDSKYEKLNKTITQKIVSLFSDLGLDSIEKYWADNDDALNELWYGVHGITKDYQIVAFVIRNDGMLCDEASFETFYNSILYKL